MLVVKILDKLLHFSEPVSSSVESGGQDFYRHCYRNGHIIVQMEMWGEGVKAPTPPILFCCSFCYWPAGCRMGLSFTGTWSTWSLLPGKWSVSLSSSLSSPSDDTRAAQNTYQCYSLPFPLEFNQHSQTSSSGCCSSGGFGIIHFAFLNIVNNCNMLVCMQEGVNYQTF